MMADEILDGDDFELELQRLIAARGEVEMTEEEAARLEKLIVSNPAACKCYVQYMIDSSSLYWQGLQSPSPISYLGSLHSDDVALTENFASLPSPIARTDSKGRQPFVRLSEDASLVSAGSSSAPVASKFRFAPLPKTATILGGVLAFALVIVLGVGAFQLLGKKDRDNRNEAAPRIAIIDTSVDALWSGDSIPDADGWLPRGSVHLNRGQVEVRFVSGAVVALKAPAQFEAISPSEARLLQGAMSARVDGSKGAFCVHTPTAEVVDLGTEFGVSVANSGETNVAVFDGIVDVSSGSKGEDNRDGKSSEAIADAPPRRLTAGEALGVNWDGDFRRIATISDDSFPSLDRSRVKEASHRPSLIANVTDNLSNGDENPHFYRIVSQGFGEDVLAFVDRRYEWNGVNEEKIPPFLIGADYIMPFNNDKWAENFEMTVTLARPATIYVLLDDRGPAPAWLKESFVDTGFNIGLDEGPFPPRLDRQLGKGAGDSVDYVFSVWKREVTQRGPVVLGPRGGLSRGRSMYGIVVTPLDSK